jgi:hypothetical protein
MCNGFLEKRVELILVDVSQKPNAWANYGLLVRILNTFGLILIRIEVLFEEYLFIFTFLI